jgi:uncharacterized protein
MPRCLAKKLIEEAVQRVVKAANNPLQVILFGSCGRGDATNDSDLDLMVVQKETLNHAEEMIRLNDAIGALDIGVDLLVYSEADFELRKNWCITPVYWAVREGKVLYDSQA